jgi:hypothetical protein
MIFCAMKKRGECIAVGELHAAAYCYAFSMQLIVNGLDVSGRGPVVTDGPQISVTKL